MTLDATAFTGRQLANLRLSLHSANDSRVRYETVNICIFPADAVRFLERVDDARCTFDSTGSFDFPPMRSSRRILSFVDPVQRVYSTAAPDGMRFSFTTIRSGREPLTTEPLPASVIMGSLLRQAQRPAFRKLFIKLADEDPRAAAEVLKEYEQYPSLFATETHLLPLDPSDLSGLLTANDREVREVAMRASSKLSRAA